MTEFDPEGLLGILGKHQVAFVVIGGYAANLQASPFLTQDVDITPQALAENLTKLSAALTDLGARIYTSAEPDGLPFAHNATSLAAVGIWNLTTRLGRLDISFVPSGTEGYDDLIQDAEHAKVHGIEIRVASLADIIRSKQAANRPKDQRVLPTLREILASRNPRNTTGQTG